MSHHVNSTIVCRISGRVMDSENEPLAFPNGYVYSSKVYLEIYYRYADLVTRHWPKWPRTISMSLHAPEQGKVVLLGGSERCIFPKRVERVNIVIYQ